MNYLAIKGELAAAHIQRALDMHTDSEGVNYEEYYEDLCAILYDIGRIKDLDTLAKFCNDYGMSDGIFPGLSFLEIIAKYWM
jgi:hypothetical protein